MYLSRMRPVDSSEKPSGTQKEFDDYLERTLIRYQDLSERYRQDTNEYFSRFCSESVLGATVLLGFISDWLTAGRVPVQTCSLLRAIPVCAWLSILASIFCGMLYLVASVRFYRHSRKLYEQFTQEARGSRSRDEVADRYQSVFACAPKSAGDGYAIAQGVLFVFGTLLLTIALFVK